MKQLLITLKCSQSFAADGRTVARKGGSFFFGLFVFKITFKQSMWQ